MERLQNSQDSRESLINFDYNIKNQNDRENQYKTKMENINGKIFDNVKINSDYLSKSPDNKLNLDPNIFELKRDFDLNKGLAENKEREKQRNNPSLVEQRLMEVKKTSNEQMERYRDYESRLKQEKMESQKIYKNLLDNQVIIN